MVLTDYISSKAFHCFAGLLLLFYQIPGNGQSSGCNLELRGLVVDSVSLTPLVGAAIQIMGKPSGTITQTDGRFSLEALCEGSYTIIISYLGYHDWSYQLELTRSKELKIKLQPAELILDEVEVKSRRDRFSSVQMASSLSNIQLSGGKSTLGEVLKELSGVNTLQTGPTIFKPVVHGLHSHRLMILNNGIAIEGQQWGAEHAPEIDPFIASDISVIKGASSVRYGSDAIGGVILIDPPSIHDTHEFGGEVNLGAMSNGRVGIISGTLESGNAKGLGWRLQGTVKRAGDFKAPGYHLSNTGVKEYNFTGAIGYQNDNKGIELYLSSFNTEIGILRASHIGNLTDLENAIGAEEPLFTSGFTYRIVNPRQRIHHQLIKLTAFKDIAGLGKLSFTYGGQYNQRKEFDIRRAGRDSKPALSLELFTNSADLILEEIKTGNFRGTIGLNATFKDNENVPETGIVPLVPDYERFDVGFFLIEQLIHPTWSLEAGIRYDFRSLNIFTFDVNNNLIKPSFNFHNLSASFGGEYFLSQNMVFSSNLGYTVRPPHTFELFSTGLHTGTGTIEEGLLISGGIVSGIPDEDDVVNEKSLKWSNTLEFRSSNLNFEITGYYHDIRNYVYLTPTGVRLTIRGAFPVLGYTQTHATLTGIDFELDYDISQHLSFHTHTSLIWAKDQSRDDFMVFIPAQNFDNSLDYNFRNKGTFNDLSISLSTLTALRQRRAPEVITIADLRSATAPISDNFDFTEPPDGYTLLNLEADFDISLNNNRELSFKLAAENILNTEYRDYMNRLRYYADDVGRNFTLSIKYDFHAH